MTAGSLITLTVSSGPDDSKIQMPNLSGMTVDEAQQKMESMGWTGQLRQQSDRTSNKPEGTITKQSVSPGTEIEKDQAITVGVSEGNGGSRFPTTTRPGQYTGVTRRRPARFAVRAFFVVQALSRNPRTAPRTCSASLAAPQSSSSSSAAPERLTLRETRDSR